MSSESVSLTEGRWSGPLPLDDRQALRLREIGRRFTSGAAQPSEAEEGDHTAVRLERDSAQTWRVRVDNAVGVLAVPGLQIVIEPKIPTEHLVHLLVRSERLPATSVGNSRVASAATFWELVAVWFVDELDRLIRAGIRRGYDSVRENLPHVRGRLDAIQSTRNVLRGRLVLTCDYDEFSGDTSLNRILRHAARLVAGAATLGSVTRQRAHAALLHLYEAGELRQTDLLSSVQSSDRSYARAIDLGRQVVQLRGRGMRDGEIESGSFLVRTPEPVEEALRRISRDALTDYVDVRKGRLPLLGCADSMKPDLVFGSKAIGDIKYKIWSGGWHRPDLNQAVAFAAGFRVTESLRVGFTGADTSPSMVLAGPIHLERCDWAFANGISPSAAEADFVERIRAWWVRAKMRGVGEQVT